LVLDPSNARIDQFSGVLKGIFMNFKKIAVTVISFDAKSIVRIRALEEKCDAKIAIFSTCNTLVMEVEHAIRAEIPSISKIMFHIKPACYLRKVKPISIEDLSTKISSIVFKYPQVKSVDKIYAYEGDDKKR